MSGERLRAERADELRKVRCALIGLQMRPTPHRIRAKLHWVWTLAGFTARASMAWLWGINTDSVDLGIF